ncbi:Swa2p [Sugiyamaella lignohabitans]|uniref:Swa2p n=1 Tax=Sugiyamaella lignohabitans TaxID=796027 RepID=A0A167EAK3_9ASCO|nr:Swa2p [Sugiyamaella lignohabitans]ANB13840.1 Swa2p [Sugiyamaella lignohabitans]
MDSFAELKWSSSGTAPGTGTSSKASSKPGTPAPGQAKGLDSFASLAPMGTGSNKPKKLESLSLQERQNMLQKGNGNAFGTSGGSSSTGGSTWSGLDLLSGGIASSERLGKSTVPASGLSNGASGSGSNSLLDGFDDIPGANEISTGSNTEGNVDPETKEDNIDDLFSVFNKPKVDTAKIEKEKDYETIDRAQDRLSSGSGSRSRATPDRQIQLGDDQDDYGDTEYNGDYDEDDYSAEEGVFGNRGHRSALNSSSNRHNSSNGGSRHSSMAGSRAESRAESRTGSRAGSGRGGSSTPSSISSRGPPAADPRDHAIAELMDMGFSDEQAIYALAQTDTGLDVRQAVDVLMMQAHQKATGQPVTAGSRSNSRRKQKDVPVDDISKLASDLSTQFISKAGSLWSMGKKNLAKAIDQYNSQPSSDGTPAWMRDAQRYVSEDESGTPPIHLDSDSDISIKRGRTGTNRPSRRFNDSDFTDDDTPPPSSSQLATDEAMMLESEGPRSRRNKNPATGHRQQPPVPPPSRRYVDDAQSNSIPVPRAVPDSARTPPPPSNTPPIAQRQQPALSRAQLLRERQKERKDDDVMYVSSSRRRGPTSSNQSSRAPTPSLPAQSPAAPSSRIASPKPSIPPREAVSISPTALTMANTSREQGTEAFKRGDFTQATEHYSQALQSIPPKHLLLTLILTNRSTCYLKCGDAKSALADAEQSLAIIGPGLGANEEVEPGKSLKDIWSKAVARKAEAYEHLEKFQDALDSWTVLISNGYSSKQSMDGKRRCQDALSPKPKPRPVTSSTPSRVSTPANDGPQSAAGKAALARVKNAHATAEKNDSERFILHDSVSSRIESWRHGKEDNLRALLGSLDNILWPESGWKKVSLAELVIPKKVKLVYMKAVARTHPDKVSSTATTEQKMIAEGVFITLNKAWDQFKVANNLS